MTSGKITADGKVLNSNGEFVAFVGDYLFGKNAKKKSSKTAGPEGQIDPSSSAVPSAKKRYVEGKRNEDDNLVDDNGVELSDKKLMDKFKITPSGNSSLDSEQLQRAKNSDRMQYQFREITNEETAGPEGQIDPSSSAPTAPTASPASKKKSAPGGGSGGDSDLLGSSPQERISSDEQTVKEIETALKKRKDTGQTVAPKLHGGETRTETINGQTTTRTVAPYPEYRAGTKLSSGEMSAMDMAIGMGGAEGYNTQKIPDIKLEQFLKQKRETISDAKAALTPNVGMITPSPNTDVGKQVAATQTARAELDAAQIANASSQSKGGTTVQTNIGGAKSNTVNVNNSPSGVRSGIANTLMVNGGR